ncbi:MAG: hypothetical protein WBQ85_00905 [Candidatus Sulfotelmatobacter sp.]
MKFAKAFLTLILCTTLVLTACSTAWIGEAEQIVAALVPAAANIVALVATLQGKSVSASDLETIQDAGAQAGADLQLLQSLIAAYQEADAAEQPGILNQIQAAINAAQATMGGLLPALHIKDAATEAKITAVVGIVLSEIQSLAAIVPLVDAGAAPAAVATAAKQVKQRPPLTASEFVAAYNATLTAKTGNADLDRATGGMRIHLHGKFERWASAGLLK